MKPTHNRSEWLAYHKDFLKSEKIGKKKFITHKNNNSPHFPSVVDYVIESEKNYSPKLPTLQRNKSQLASNIIKKEQEVQVEIPKIKELEEKIIEKDFQIKVLRNLYSVANYRQKDKSIFSEITFGNKQRIKKYESENTNRERNYRNSLMMSEKNKINTPSLARNHSVSNEDHTNYLNYASRLVLSQKKYTKSRPKIILTNPITGVVPFGQ